MKVDPDDLAAILRRVEQAGGKSLRMVVPVDGPAAPDPPPRPSKYGNVRTEYAGVTYDSKAEADYAASLDDQARVMPGMFWVRQVTFRLGCPENLYRADFLVYRPDWPDERICAVDVKGARTAKFERDVKLWAAYGPCRLFIVRRAGRAWESEVVRGGGAGRRGT